MSDERAVLARHRLARARDELATADELRGAGWHVAAASRLYYAAFHAARALLAAAGAHATSHKGAIIMFQKHFVKTGRIAVETAKALPRTFEFRQEADYADFLSVSEQLVIERRNEVAAFVEACDALLDQTLDEANRSPDRSRV